MYDIKLIEEYNNVRKLSDCRIQDNDNVFKCARLDLYQLEDIYSRFSIGVKDIDDGDWDHGNRVYMSLERDSNFASKCIITEGIRKFEFDDFSKIELIFGGRIERDSIINALKFFTEMLAQLTIND